MMLRVILLAFCALLVVASMALLPLELAGQRDSSLLAQQGGAALTPQEVEKALSTLSQDERDRLIKRELKALESEPLDADALRNLTLLPSLGGGRTPEYTLALARISLRNTAAQLMAMGILSKAKRHDELMLHMDVLLRTEPTLRTGLFTALKSIAEEKEAQPALARTLATSPPWRTAFMANLASLDPGGQLTYSILAALRADGKPPQDVELRYVLSSWVKAKRFEQAYFLWLDFLSTTDLTRAVQVFDGGFDLEPRSMHFDWTFVPVKNVSMAVANKPGSATDRALVVDFAGHKGSFTQVSQMLRLAPGVYSVTFDQQTRSLKTTGGLNWAVYCLDKSQLLGRSKAIVSDMSWQAEQFTITVPEADCATQLLRLETASRAALDTAISGQFMFDNIAIKGLEPSPGAVE